MHNAYGIELFSADTAKKIERAVPRCVSLIKACQKAGPAACALARAFCAARIVDYFPIQERNIYDIRKPCAVPPLCYDFDNIAAWLGRPEVRQVRQARVSDVYDPCSPNAHRMVARAMGHGSCRCI